MVDLAERMIADEVPPGYWMTELGLLPEDWSVVPLGDVAAIRGGKRLPKGHQFADEMTPYPYIRVVDFRGTSVDCSNLRYLQPRDHEIIKRYIITSDDVYISIAGTVGVVGTVPLALDGANLTENAARLVLRPNAIDKNFLPFYLSSAPGQAQIALRTTKTSQPKLALTRIRDIPIPLPPLSEQRAIAHVLSTVQRAREATEAVIAATRELKRSLMRHLFTYGPVPVDQVDGVRLKETEIGLVPEGWEVRPLSDCASLSTGTTPSTRRRDYYEGHVPFVKTGEIVNNIITRTLAHISNSAVADYRLQIYDPGTVMLAMYGQGKTRGQVSLLSISAAITQNTAAIVSSDDLDSRFLWMHLMSRYEFLRGEGIQGHISHLNLGFVAKLSMPVPPLPVQREIAEALIALTNKLNTELASASALQELADSLLKATLTGAVRVRE